MAKRKVSPEERYHRRLLGELLRSQTVAGETDAETCAALGLSLDTWTRARKQRPETFKADEIFRAKTHFGWGPEELTRIFVE